MFFLLLYSKSLNLMQYCVKDVLFFEKLDSPVDIKWCFLFLHVFNK